VEVSGAFIFSASSRPSSGHIATKLRTLLHASRRPLARPAIDLAEPVHCRVYRAQRQTAIGDCAVASARFELLDHSPFWRLGALHSAILASAPLSLKNLSRHRSTLAPCSDLRDLLQRRPTTPRPRHSSTFTGQYHHRTRLPHSAAIPLPHLHLHPVFPSPTYCPSLIPSSRQFIASTIRIRIPQATRCDCDIIAQTRR